MATAGLTACGDRQGSLTSANAGEPGGEMTYRTLTGDRVSLLGYGCMRWPMMPNPDGEGQVVDQEEVNRLVDYALAHGVNYFDTAPPYCQGLSEEATGIALSRHPRDSYYIATKMSNHRLYGAGLRGKELHDASVKMYRDSFKHLRTDYFDYYLFHILGTGAGMEEMRGRLYDCGIADFILKEKEAGRIRKLGFSFHGDVRVFDYMLQESGIPWDLCRYSSITLTGGTHRASTSMPNTSTANWRSGTSPPSLWNRCWADGSPKYTTTSSPS